MFKNIEPICIPLAIAFFLLVIAISAQIISNVKRNDKGD